VARLVLVTLRTCLLFDSSAVERGYAALYSPLAASNRDRKCLLCLRPVARPTADAACNLISPLAVRVYDFGFLILILILILILDLLTDRTRRALFFMSSH
jgi:hypothetical protein